MYINKQSHTLFTLLALPSAHCCFLMFISCCILSRDPISLKSTLEARLLTKPITAALYTHRFPVD